MQPLRTRLIHPAKNTTRHLLCNYAIQVFFCSKVAANYVTLCLFVIGRVSVCRQLSQRAKHYLGRDVNGLYGAWQQNFNIFH